MKELERLRQIEAAARNLSRCHKSDEQDFRNGDLYPCQCEWHIALNRALAVERSEPIRVPNQASVRARVFPSAPGERPVSPKP